MQVKIMKIIIVVLLLAILAMGCLAYLQYSRMFIIEENSYFSDFYVKGDKAYIECVMVIESPRDCDIRLLGTFPKDEGKLLKNSSVFAYDPESESDTFHLARGRNRFEVVFIGEYGGTYRKHDRLLPEIDIAELN
ncbi:MAG: hypothetical protein IKM21_00600 [Oscillospiraceae bacterium]|nr:hypothetical protein [Oscillospiraceae bacterium]